MPRCAALVALFVVQHTVGCAGEPECANLRPWEGIQNHVQTFEVAVDADARRLYTTALGSRVMLAYDADSHEVLFDLPVGNDPLVTPEVEVDLAGRPWIAASGDPAIMLFDPQTRDRTIHWDILRSARDLAPRQAGGMVYLGLTEDSNNILAALDADGVVKATLDVGESAKGLIPMDDFTRVGVTLASGALLVLDSDDLSEVQRCEIALRNPWHGAQLDDGTVIVSAEGGIGTAACGDEAALAWPLGQENMEVVSLGDHAVVLDRMADEEGYDPNLGIARLVDATGLLTSYPTFKNTGFGALDPETGLLWLNSEGTSELLAVHPADGALEVGIPGGTFIDGLMVDPEDSSVLYATGRLSDTLVRIEGTELTHAHDDLHWPYAPVVDLQRDTLWVMSQTESTLHAFDRHDLEPGAVIDTGLGPNTLLTFGGLMMNVGRGTLFFAHSQLDLLLEIDPDSGEELGRWDLGGPLITDPDEVGELALRVTPEAEHLLVVRSNDARVQRIDTDSMEVTTVFMPEEVAEALGNGHKTDFMRYYPGDDLLYIGGMAVDVQSLERWEEKDLEVTRLAGRHPVKDSQWIAVDDDQQRIVRLSEKGRVRGSISFAKNELHATVFKVSPEERSVYMTRALHGNVCSFPVAWLR